MMREENIMFDIKGKYALVTGGTRGIGKAIAYALYEKGAKVAIFYRSNKEKAEKVAGKINGIALKVDLTKVEEIRKGVNEVISQFGTIDILVNNAGIIGNSMSTLKVTEEEWDLLMDTNLKGMFFVTQAVLPYMMKKGGKIVNLASIAGRMGGAAGAHYAASKAGAIGLTRRWATEFAKYGICVNAIAPGPVDTGLLTEELKKQLSEITPLGRVATPSEIAHTAIYLIENDYVTGAVADINGGRYMG